MQLFEQLDSYFGGPICQLCCYDGETVHMNDLETASVVVIAEYSGRRHRIARIKVEN